MRRFLREFNFIMKSRRHFFFLVVLWTMLSVVTFAYGISLDNTVDLAFKDKGSTEKNLSFTIEAEEEHVISAEILENEIALNRLLRKDENFSYSCFYDTTSTITKLTNLDLSVDADTTTDGDGADGKKNYKVKTLFIDRETAEAAGFNHLLYVFDIPCDYEENTQVLLGYEWLGEGLPLGTASEEIISEVDNYKICAQGYVTKGFVFTNSDVTLELDKYIIIPLQDMENNTFPTTQEGRRRWYDIYRIKNQGTICTDMSPNALQKYLDDLMEEKELPYRLLVKGADYKNSIVFRDNIGEITEIVSKISYFAMILATLILIGYLIASYSISSRYLFLSYMTGTGKLEFSLIGILHLIIYFIIIAASSYVVLFALCRLTSASICGVKYIILPAAVISLTGMLVNTIRIVLWDAGKKLRSI
ncbi:MAG: hypothetical protein ACI39R_02360 [Lachnospiraceae bacterium]